MQKTTHTEIMEWPSTPVITQLPFASLGGSNPPLGLPVYQMVLGRRSFAEGHVEFDPVVRHDTAERRCEYRRVEGNDPIQYRNDTTDLPHPDWIRAH